MDSRLKVWLALASCFPIVFSASLDIPVLLETCGLGRAPRTTVLDGQRLVYASLAVAVGESSSNLALHHLTKQADEWLTQGPWSVMNKNEAGPSGSKHDYVSQSPYWWPSDSADGCPYVFRDGQRNPEIAKWPDASTSYRMMESSYILTLAWYYTGNSSYGQHASNILKTWFLDEETRMTPSLAFAQTLPCPDSRIGFGGIIEFSQIYSAILDAVAILTDSHAPGWACQDTREFKKWNVQFLKWLIESEQGQLARAATNNHGTFHAMLCSSIGYFVRDFATAREFLGDIKHRIDADIAANGTQPGELWRTRPWHYSNFNLVAFTRAADVAEKLDVDLWNYKGPEGQSIIGAIEYLIPAALNGSAAWPYEDMGFLAWAATDNIHVAAERGSLMAKEALDSGRLQKPPQGDLWPLRPAVEQLDALQD